MTGNSRDRSTEPPQEEVRHVLVLHGATLNVELIELALNHGFFNVRPATNLAEAEAILADRRLNMAVIDMDHHDNAAVLRALGVSDNMTMGAIPALRLTRRGDLATKLSAFQLGVDDILGIPFSPEELLARSLVITRRASGLNRPIVPRITLGGIDIDIAHGEVRAGDSIVHLSAIEKSLLHQLACRAGSVVSRDEILDGIWGSDFVPESNVVDQHIRALRIKLQDDYRRPRLIATVAGRGYRFLPTFSNAGWAWNDESTKIRDRCRPGDDDPS